MLEENLTINTSAGSGSRNPSDTYGYIQGDFYRLSCVFKLITKSIEKVVEHEVSLANLLRDLPNLVLDANDSDLKNFLSSKGIDIAEGKNGEDNLLRLDSLGSYPEIRPLVRPNNVSLELEDEQGKANAMALIYRHPLAVWISHIDLVKLVNESLKKILGFVDEELRDQILSESYKNCLTKQAKVNHLFLDNVDIKADALFGAKDQGPIKYYNEDAMTSRRPPGEFFTVEMVAPSDDGTPPVRVDLQTANSVVSSLILNMSPASLVVNSSKKTSRTPSLIRWIEEHWGDEMDQITFNGTSFSFLDFKTNSSGLCVSSRNMTEPYKELRHLVDIYKMNGMVYQSEKIEKGEERRTFFNKADPANPYTVGSHPRAGLPKYRLYIKMRCYLAEFIGYFDSFDVTESADKPYSLSYSVSFKSEHTKWL